MFFYNKSYAAHRVKKKETRNMVVTSFLETRFLFFFSTKCLQHECLGEWGFSRASFTRRVGRPLSTRRANTITIRSTCSRVVALRHAVNISEASTPICLCMRPHANNCPPARPLRAGIYGGT